MSTRAVAAFLAVTLVASAASAEDKAPTRHAAGPWIVIVAGATTAAIGVLSFVGAAIANHDAGVEARANGCTTSPSVVCPTGYDATHLRSLVDGEHAMNWIGAVMTIAGGGATIAGVAWHFTEPVRVQSVVGPGVAMLSITARF